MGNYVRSSNGRNYAYFISFQELYEELGNKVKDIVFEVGNPTKKYVLLQVPPEKNRMVPKPVRIPLEFYNSIAGDPKRKKINGSELLPLLKKERVVEGGKDYITISQAYCMFAGKKNLEAKLVERHPDYSKFRIYYPFAVNIPESEKIYMITSTDFINGFVGMDTGTESELRYLLSEYEKCAASEDKRLERIVKKLKK